MTTIGEVKTPGGIGRAKAETLDYLTDATDRPLVGIATDGFTWRLYTAREGEEPKCVRRERIYTLIRRLRTEQEFSGPRKRRLALREEALGVARGFSVGELMRYS